MMIRTMKKLVLTVAVVSLCIFPLFGCSNAESGEEPQGQNQLEITLDENPTTGYTWECEIADESVALLKSDEYVEYENSDDTAGAGGVHKYVFEGEQEGTTQITMTLGQHWEGGEIEKTKTIKVTVDDKGCISKRKK